MLNHIIPSSFKSKIYNALFETPPLYKQSIIANTLGLQTIRTLYLNCHILHFFNKKNSLKKQLKEHVNILERDGCVIINNFLPDDLYQQVKSEYYQLEPFFNLISEKRPKRKKLTLINWADLRLPKNFPESIAQAFLNNKGLKYIVEKTGKAPLNILPTMAVYKDWYEKSDLGKNSNADKTHNLHADVTYPSIKAFYYVEDVAVEQGALVYAKGSHKLNIKRLMLDHTLSKTFSKKGGYYFDVTDEQKQRYNLHESKLSAPANSLVLFNVMGFHKRGDFEVAKSRNIIVLCYRQQKSMLNHLFNFNKIKSYFVNGSNEPKPLPKTV